MQEYPATTVGDLMRVLTRYNPDAVVMIPTETPGILTPLGRVITNVFAADAAHELAENVFDSTGDMQTAVALLPDDDEEVTPADDATPNCTL